MTNWLVDPQPSRSQVRSIRCPVCGAAINELCRGKRDKKRESNHRERVDQYLWMKEASKHEDD